MRNIRIIVAAHKRYWMPKDKIYLPLHVGKEGKEDFGFIGDNTGDNISVKNSYYCELTGLYWAWRNLDCEYLGLVHYRRYFTYKNRLFIWRNGKQESVLSSEELSNLIKYYDVIVPKKRRYYIESLYSHYAHTHYEEHLVKTRDIICETYPEYLKHYDHVMKQTAGYMFNMFIMKKQLADEYCSWLFDVLGRLEQRVDYNQYDTYQARLFGRVSELLFNVWLDYKGISVKEVATIHMERINWMVKGKAFLEAKFRKKKFKGSF